MSGPIGLHGGGEYVAGDERFLDALLQAARRTAAARHVGGTRLEAADDVTASRSDALPFDAAGDDAAPAGPIRIVLLPTAAGRGRPEAATTTGRAGFERRAAATGARVTVEVAPVVDAASADDPRAASQLAEADLIHLPGGDPDLVPTVLRDSRALAAIETAWRRGAVIAGASAGAMGLAEWTWTPGGGIRGLGFVRGIAVVPHYDDVRRTRWQQALDELAPGGIGYLGLDERTGVLSEPNGPDGPAWRVVGRGTAYWFGRGTTAPRTGRHGDILRLG